MFSIYIYIYIYFFENRAVYEIMWINIVERGRPQMTVWRMRISRWIPKDTDTHSEHVIFIAFSTATMVARTRLNVTIHAHCMPCTYHLNHLQVSEVQASRQEPPIQLHSKKSLQNATNK